MDDKATKSSELDPDCQADLDVRMMIHLDDKTLSGARGERGTDAGSTDM